MKILVVDDEQVQVESIARGLNLYGYQAVTAGGVEEALGIFEDPDSGIDIVLTDLTMPERSGFELISRIRELRPAVPIIVITGLNTSSEVEEVRDSGVPVLQKPFSPDQLDQAIRDVVADGAERDADLVG